MHYKIVQFFRNEGHWEKVKIHIKMRYSLSWLQCHMKHFMFWQKKGEYEEKKGYNMWLYINEGER